MSKKHVDKQGRVKKPTAVKKSDASKEGAGQPAKQLNESSLTQLQQTVGNTAVQSLIVQRQAQGPQALEDDTAESIRQAKRQEGQKLDPATADQASQVMGHNMHGVNIHTDSQADELTQQVGAKAFTTGNDVFFKQGAYDPGSAQGQELIGHELTHVAQQSAGSQQVSAKADESAPSGQMTVNDPGDKYEAEADHMATQFVSGMKTAGGGGETTAVQRQEEDELQMQMQEEDELQMQEEDELQMQEEDELQMQEEGELQMQEEDELQMQEEDELQMQEEDELQMQELPEEDEKMRGGI